MLSLLFRYFLYGIFDIMLKHFYLFLLLFSSTSFSNPVQDKSEIVRVRDCEFVFRKSSFEGLKDNHLHDWIFGNSVRSRISRWISSKILNKQIDLTGKIGIHLDTFEGIYTAIEKNRDTKDDRKLPKTLESIEPWKVPRKQLPQLSKYILSEIMSYVPDDLDNVYLEDLKILGLKGKISLSCEGHPRAHYEDGFKYYVINLAGVDFEFVRIPNGDDIEYMMSTAVTQGQWRAITGENPAYFAGRGDDLPMENVSHDDIVTDFLPNLNTFLREAGFDEEFRLPSFEEWQRMAAKNIALDFEDNKSKYSDFGKSLSDPPSSVRLKAVGSLGARMFGGVWEWVGSSNPAALICGGSWNSDSEEVGPSVRYSDNPRLRIIGFRLFLQTFPGQA